MQIHGMQKSQHVPALHYACYAELRTFDRSRTLEPRCMRLSMQMRPNRTAKGDTRRHLCPNPELERVADECAGLQAGFFGLVASNSARLQAVRVPLATPRPACSRRIVLPFGVLLNFYGLCPRPLS